MQGAPTVSERPESGRTRHQGKGTGRNGIVIGVVAAIAVLIAVGVWLFAAGPLSESGRDERAARDVVENVDTAESMAEFNALLCEERRAPDDLIEMLQESYQEEGTDVDSVFLEQVRPNVPDDLSIDDVNIDGDTAVVATSSGGGEVTEEIDLVREDGEWRICEDAPTQ